MKRCIDCFIPIYPQSMRCSSCAARLRWKEGKGNHPPHSVRPSEVRVLSQIEAAWLGAMIEGEGSILLSPRGLRGAIAVGNTEVETIATCLRFAGCGTIQAANSKNQKPHWKQMWLWRVAARNSVTDLLEQVSPYLTGKREKAQQAISCLKGL